MAGANGERVCLLFVAVPNKSIQRLSGGATKRSTGVRGEWEMSGPPLSPYQPIEHVMMQLKRTVEMSRGQHGYPSDINQIL